MKQDDNLKEFFKKRLDEAALTEDQWNTPSDDIWNSAKGHFPEKKRRRFPFLFLLIGLIGCGTIAILGSQYFVANQAEQPVAAAIVTTEIATTKNEQAARQDIKTSQKNSEVINATANATDLVNVKRDELQLANSNTINEASPENIKTIATENWSNKKVVETSEVILPIFTPKKEIKTGAVSAVKNNEKLLNSRVNELQSIEEIKEVEISNEVAALDLLATRVDVLKAEENEETAFKVLEVAQLPSWKRWEVGLTHAPFVFSPKALIELEDDPDFQHEVDWTYRNFNIQLSRKFNKRFSLTSGLSRSKINIGLDMSEKVIYQMGSTDEILRNLIEENPVGGSIELDTESSDVAFEFSDNANLQDGDELELQVSLPLNLAVVQIPFLLNFHIPRGKFEWSLHAGFSVDYFEAFVELDKFEVFKEGKLISEEVQFDPLMETDFGLSFYAGGGLKYHLNNRFNLGVNTKIDLGIIPLARYEVGMFYKF